MKEEKNLVMNIILSLVTCGLFALYWFVTLTDDAKEFSKDESMQSGGLALVLTIVTCGIFGFYWAYKMGKMIEQAQKNYGLNAKDNSILYIILQLFGLGIVGYALMQNDLNEITRASNSGNQAQAA